MAVTPFRSAKVAPWARRVAAAMLLLALYGCREPVPVQAEFAREPVRISGSRVRILGVAQDGGVPHAACRCTRCVIARRDVTSRRHAASIAIVLPASDDVYLIDATPDVREQLAMLDDVRHGQVGGVDRSPLAGLFLTHAHMGHYTGLVHFGFEAVSTSRLPVYGTASMNRFLTQNAPWDRLVSREHVLLRTIAPGAAIDIGAGVTVTPIAVPHRREYTDTVGFEIAGPRGSVLYVPDTDGWASWPLEIERAIARVDVALLDGTFFSGDELPGRALDEIGHPLIRDSIARFGEIAKSSGTEIRFIHLNHSNPALTEGSDARREIEAAQFRVAHEGDELPL